MNIPFLNLKSINASFNGELEDAADRVVRSGQYILGEEVASFEREFADYCGSTHALGVSNGLDALHMILRALDIGPGDEVIVPANTFIATWLAVSFCGAKPVPVEPEPDGFNIDLNAVDAAITPRRDGGIHCIQINIETIRLGLHWHRLGPTKRYGEPSSDKGIGRHDHLITGTNIQCTQDHVQRI